MPFYHVWFSPKNRKAVLDGDLAEAAREELRRVAAERAVDLLACELSYDHVHLLIRLEENQTLPSVMHWLKGASAHQLFQRFPDLKMDLGHTAFWQRGYGFRKIPDNQVGVVRAYIRQHRELSEPRVFNPRGAESR